MTTIPLTCRCCGFPDPVGGLADRNGERQVCELCGEMPVVDQDEQAVIIVLAAVNRGLNLLRKDIEHLRAEVDLLPPGAKIALLNEVEVAALICASCTQVRRMAKKGTIPARTLPNGDWVFDRQELAAWCANLPRVAESGLLPGAKDGGEWDAGL